MVDPRLHHLQRKRGDLGFSPGVKAQLGNREGAIGGENRFLRLGELTKGKQEDGE